MMPLICTIDATINSPHQFLQILLSGHLDQNLVVFKERVRQTKDAEYPAFLKISPPILVRPVTEGNSNKNSSLSLLN